MRPRPMLISHLSEQPTFLGFLEPVVESLLAQPFAVLAFTQGAGFPEIQSGGLVFGGGVDIAGDVLQPFVAGFRFSELGAPLILARTS